MMQILDQKTEDAITPLFRLSFRPFFLFGTVMGVFTVLITTLIYTGMLPFQPRGGFHWWHAHEMLFGFASAIIAGFLLTAVQTWTGVPGIRGKKLIVLFVLWISARLLNFLPHNLPQVAVALVDASFLPLAAYFYAIPLVKIRQIRNLVFTIVLGLFAWSNISMHLSIILEKPIWFEYGLNLGVFLTTVAMIVIGGRVIPMFTANGTRTEKVQPNPVVDGSAVGSILLVTFLFASGLNKIFPEVVQSVALLFAGLVNVVRVTRWRFWITLRTPIVWSLHLAYYSISFALILLALAPYIPTLTWSNALHALTVGGMSGLIMAMISRVTLGHTGRPLILKKIVPFAYLCLSTAMLFRVFGVWLGGQQILLMMAISAILWILAFMIYIWIYAPVLLSPRPDGRPG